MARRLCITVDIADDWPTPGSASVVAMAAFRPENREHVQVVRGDWADEREGDE